MLEKLPWSTPGKVFSVAPKLWVTTSIRFVSMSCFSTFIISGRPVTPSVSATGVSARMMCAPGAIAWAYSTSRVVSCAQPTIVESLGSKAGTLPYLTTSTVVFGKPHCWSKTFRSFWIVGEPNESTIRMVRPAPVIPAA